MSLEIAIIRKALATECGSDFKCRHCKIVQDFNKPSTYIHPTKACCNHCLQKIELYEAWRATQSCFFCQYNTHPEALQCLAKSGFTKDKLIAIPSIEELKQTLDMVLLECVYCVSCRTKYRKINHFQQYNLLRKQRAKECAICARPYDPSHSAAWDWDHVDPSSKVDSISDIVQHGTKSNWRDYLHLLMNEYEKCRLLCKNCHQKVSSQQKEEREQVTRIQDWKATFVLYPPFTATREKKSASKMDEIPEFEFDGFESMSPLSDHLEEIMNKRKLRPPPLDKEQLSQVLNKTDFSSKLE